MVSTESTDSETAADDVATDDNTDDAVEEEEEEEPVDPTVCEAPCCYATDPDHPAAMKCLEIGDAKQFCKQQRTIGCAWKDFDDEQDGEQEIDGDDDDDDE